MVENIPEWAKINTKPPAAPAWAQQNVPASAFMQNLGADEPGYKYGEILPIKRETAPHPGNEPSDLSKIAANAIMGVSGGRGGNDLSLAVPETLRSMTRGLGDLMQQGETKTINPTPDSINAMMGLATVPSLAESAATKIGARLADKTPRAGLLESQSSDPMAVSTKPEPFKPEDFQAGINKTYESAKASRKPFYDFMKEAAGDQTVDVSGALAPAQKVIAEIEGDPFNPARPVLGRLKDFVENYGNNPQMPLADAVEMKQDINSFFNPKKFDQGSKSPYFQVGNALDSQIEKAAEINPIFGKAKTLADQNHVNNVALPFTENKLLEPFWKPQDYYAAKSMENGPAAYLPDETRLRANQMISNVKNPEQLDAITRAMPPDMAAQFRAAVGKGVTSGSKMYRARELGNILGQPLAAPKHLFNAVVGQPYSASEKALIAASKGESPQLDATLMGKLIELKMLGKDSQ